MAKDTELNNFCKNVTELRKEKGLTQKQMAEILGISVKSIRKIEQDEFPPRITVEIFYNIYDNFGICPSQLFKRN